MEGISVFNDKKIHYELLCAPVNKLRTNAYFIRVFKVFEFKPLQQTLCLLKKETLGVLFNLPRGVPSKAIIFKKKDPVPI